MPKTSSNKHRQAKGETPVFAWIDVVPDERDKLIDRVRHGEIEPEEAEARAAALGLPPFESKPNPAQFDPMKEPHWTLPMVLVWLMSRNPDCVREMWDEFRLGHSKFQPTRWRTPDGPVVEGYELRQREPANLIVVSMACIDPTDEPEMRVDFTTAEAVLTRKLSEGTVGAYGLNEVTGKRVQIPADEWIDLKLVDKQYGRRTVLVVRGGGREYSDVRLRSDDARRISVDADNPHENTENKRKRGRQSGHTLYDWLSFEAEVVAQFEYRGDFIKEEPGWTKSKLVAEMMGWCNARWDKSPSKTSIKKRVNRAYVQWLNERRSQGN